MRVVVLGDSLLALPAFEVLARRGLAAGLCTSSAASSDAARLRHLADTCNVPALMVDRRGVEERLSAWVTELHADVMLVATFAYRLPRAVFQAPRLGSFNVHFAKLPEYRGPQPIFWEIRNRETHGAVTVHEMDDQLDHGPIVASLPVPIVPEDTYGLHAVRLGFAAAAVVEQVLGALAAGVSFEKQPQDETRAKSYPRPSLQDVVIRWEDRSGADIRALVKATNPWNQGAFTSVRGINLRITDVSLIEDGGTTTKEPGEILLADAQRGLLVNCRDGTALSLDVVSIAEGFLPGRALASLGIRDGERFTAPGWVTKTGRPA